VIELGSGCALPSLLTTTLRFPPKLVVITDYPDETIMDNLRQNVARNKEHVREGCVVRCEGYAWGQDPCSLLSIPPDLLGYDVVILSDLVHFDKSHDDLLSSLTSLLRRSPDARAYVAAGKYTPYHVCDSFLAGGEKLGLEWQEGEMDDHETWKGTLDVRGGGLDREQLGVRKANCRWWAGRWSSEVLSGIASS